MTISDKQNYQVYHTSGLVVLNGYSKTKCYVTRNILFIPQTTGNRYMPIKWKLERQMRSPAKQHTNIAQNLYKL